MENIENKEDEISLIDLFLVLLKYRKLIAIITAFCMILGAVTLFALPKFVPSLSKAKFDIIYSVKVNELPPNISSKIDNIKLEKFFTYFMTSNKTVADVYSQHPFTNDELSTGYKYNLYIYNLIRQKKYEVKTVNPGYFEIHITTSESNINNANDFVSEMIANTEVLMQKISLEAVENLRISTMDLLASAKNSDVSATADYVKTLKDIELFNASKAKIIDVSKEGFIIPESQGRFKKTIIITFAGFFISVFLAFLLNAWDNIKKDTETYNKILEVLGKK